MFYKAEIEMDGKRYLAFYPEHAIMAVVVAEDGKLKLQLSKTLEIVNLVRIKAVRDMWREIPGNATFD